MDRHHYYAIDHLRTCMMFVVVIGHPLLPYVTVPRPFKDPNTHVGFDVAAVFLYAFAMQAFFVTAGFAAGILMKKKGKWGLCKNRFRRILVPLTLAYLLITPLMRGAYEFAQAVVEFDAISAGWNVILSADWIRWGKLYHLWFLLSLLVFTGLAMAGLTLLHKLKAADTLSSALANSLADNSGMWLLAVIVSLTTIPSYILESGSGTHWSMQITLFGYFALGWFLHAHQDIIKSWQSQWRTPLATAIIVLPVCAWASRIRLFNEHTPDLTMGLLAGVTNGVVGITMTIALVGWFHLKLDKPTKWGEHLGRSSYWVYLIHFPIVVAVAGVVTLFDVPALVKYAATLVIAIPLIALSHYLSVCVTSLFYATLAKTHSLKKRNPN